MIQLIGKRSLIAEGIVYRKQLVLIKGLNQVAWIADLTTEIAWLRVLIKLCARQALLRSIGLVWRLSSFVAL